MPSPFPGMDPFIESEEWYDFHPTFNGVLRELLAPIVHPAYVVRVERRIYIDHGAVDGAERIVEPDVVIERASPVFASPSAATSLLPAIYEIPVPVERRESFLTIRHVESHAVVCVIETLSPSNKRPGSDGRRAYMAKREEVLQSEVHLVELDLLRSPRRLPIIGDPPGDYYALISRSYLRPKVEVYSWNLLDPLPEINVPLLREDGVVSLNLRRAVDMVYDRAIYGRTLDYHREPAIPLSPEQRQWLDERLAQLASDGNGT
jgi:hypothetical protein